MRHEIAVVAISVLVGGILAGHPIAGNMACVIGLRPYCWASSICGAGIRQIEG